ncbi:hypothetical protein ACLOJK_005957 [Asimina triloba]
MDPSLVSPQVGTGTDGRRGEVIVIPGMKLGLIELMPSLSRQFHYVQETDIFFGSDDFPCIPSRTGSMEASDLTKFVLQVKYVIGLYPFLAMNKASITQNALVKITASQILCVTVSSVLAVIGLLPHWASEFLVRILVGGTSWTATAVEATRTHLLKEHALRIRPFQSPQ